MSPVEYPKDLFFVFFSYSYILMIIYKLNVKFSLFVYAEDTCLVLLHKDITEIEKNKNKKNQNKDFE